MLIKQPTSFAMFISTGGVVLSQINPIKNLQPVRGISGV